ncbi:MAG: hypothetical protein IJ272_05490, partial [Clostridia bacterium]|nr:hypothetical protein [Clostridia bacterium]
GITVVSRIVIAKVNRDKKFSTSEYGKNIMNLSNYLFKVFAVIGYKKQKGMTIEEYFIYLYKNNLVSKDMFKKLSLCMRKACYSAKDISEQEYKSFKEDVENIVEIQYNELSLKDKLKFRVIYTL